MRALRSGGIDALLRSFEPTMHWRSPVLEVEHPADRRIDLGGRGIQLIPSYFCWRIPVTLVDPALMPVMVYPIAPETRRGEAIEQCPDEDTAVTLTRLLGTTRARVLRAAQYTCTTTEIDRLAKVSVASASLHTAVLRDAGLIQSRRDGAAVLHSLSPLGSALLFGRPRPPR